MNPTPRYAVYFAPDAASRWWDAGCLWLGRDPSSDVIFPQPDIDGVPPSVLSTLTTQARRYGLHATLAPPFRLAAGFDEGHLDRMAQAFAQVQSPIAAEDMQVRRIGDCLALRPAHTSDDIAALAMRCITYFNVLRAAPNEAELAKRRRAGLSVRQEALLQRWGYPYTEEQFRFHLTLTDGLTGLDDVMADKLRQAAENHFRAAQTAAPMQLDAITIFREAQPGAPLRIWRRYPLRAAPPCAALPTSGTLFFVVGPSGVGKDTLLRWVQARLPDTSGTLFAQRTITRAAHPSETHDAVDVETFWKRAADGQFAMLWQANDVCYGIGRGIEADLQAGRYVVVNGSREYIAQLRSLFPNAHVIWIDADSAHVHERLHARQREAGAALLQRLDRNHRLAAPLVSSGNDRVYFIDNSGPIDIAGEQLLRILAS